MHILKFRIFLQNLKAIRSVSGAGFTVFGEPSGAIFKLSRNLEEYCWIAHKRSLADIALAGLTLATVGVSPSNLFVRISKKNYFLKIHCFICNECFLRRHALGGRETKMKLMTINLKGQ